MEPHIGRARRVRYFRYFRQTIDTAAAIACFVFMFSGAIDSASASASASTSTHLPPWRWKTGYWRITTETSYFTSDANYDETRGSFIRLPSENKFEVIHLGLRSRYNLSKRFSLFAGTNIASASSRDAFTDRSNSSLTDIHLGTDILLLQKWIRLTARFEASYPFDEIDTETTHVLTNDGVAYARATLFLYKPFSWFNTYVHVGLNYRDEGLAALAIWGAGLEKPLARRYLLGIGAEGYETAIGDELSESARTRVTDRVNAGSAALYAYDPASLQVHGWVGWSPANSWQIRLGYARTLDGIRSAAGQTVFLNISHSFEPQPDREAFQYHKYKRDNSSRRSQRLEKAREKVRKKTRKAFESFEVENERTDPSLFDEDEGFEPDVEPDPLTDTERLLEGRRLNK